jgi:predicted metal-dependent hydrolase
MNIYNKVIIIFVVLIFLILLLSLQKKLGINGVTNGVINDFDIVMGLLFIFLIGFLIYNYTYYDIVTQESKIDKNTYYVRDMTDKQKAADKLATIKKNIDTFNKHLYENRNKPEYKKYKNYIEQLNNNLKDTLIMETSGDSNHTSYSVNKGEQLVFCLRDKNTNEFHDINLLMYVVLHELAHVACPEYGHTSLFKDIFAFFTQEAIKIKLYNKIDFNLNNKEYCGMTITESII